MKLELKHWTSYLPYNVNLKSNEGRIPSVMTGIQYPYIECTLEHNIANHFSNFSLILRPLSDLTKEIEVDGEKFIPIENLGYDKEYRVTFYEKGRYFYVYRNGIHVICFQGEMIDLLLSWHFDIFGLIDAGLAVDINTVKF